MAVDLAERVTRMEERVDAELRHLATREDMQALRGEIIALEVRLMRWMVMIVAAGVGVTVALVELI
ncbi:MAG: hypothetical protein OXS35_00195 [Dehalococcoidia bacterium]|nr:hypothetical protein [Dehalococcoidia bacterium]